MVARLLWEQKVPGSSPGAPTKAKQDKGLRIAVLAAIAVQAFFATVAGIVVGSRIVRFSRREV